MTGPSRTVLVAAVAALLAGVVAATVGVVHIARDIVRTVNAPVLTAPIAVDRHFDAADYEVYEQTGYRSGGGGFTFSQGGPPTLTPSDVTVTSQTGVPVPTRLPGGNETLTRGQTVYTAAVRFTVTTAGDYTVEIHTTGTPTGPDVIIAKSLGSVVRGIVKWIVVTALGGLVAIAAIVVLIVALVRSRRRSTPAGPVPAIAGAMPLPAPGWYPDPGGSGRSRWWDGTRWTEHIG